MLGQHTVSYPYILADSSSPGRKVNGPDQPANVLFPAALAFAQRFLAAAAIRARAAAENLRLGLLEAPAAFFFPRLAQRALWAAAILARVAADLRPLPPRLPPLAGADEPMRRTNSSSNPPMRSLSATARRSCSSDKFISMCIICGARCDSTFDTLPSSKAQRFQFSLCPDADNLSCGKHDNKRPRRTLLIKSHLAVTLLVTYAHNIQSKTDSLLERPRHTFSHTRHQDVLYRLLSHWTRSVPFDDWQEARTLEPVDLAQLSTRPAVASHRTAARLRRTDAARRPPAEFCPGRGGIVQGQTNPSRCAASV